MPSNIGATEHHQFYGTGSGAAAVAVDQAGNANMTAGTDAIYTSSFGYGTPCTVMVAMDYDSATTRAGFLFSRHSGGTVLQGLRYDDSTSLEVYVNGSVVQTLTVPTSGEMVVSWSMVEDPINASMVRSEVRVWEADGGTFEAGVSWSHTEPAGLAASDIVWGADDTSESNSTGGALQGAGFLLHEAGSVQVHRDRVSAATAPTLTGSTAMEHPMPDWSSNFGAQDRPAGPTHYIGAGAVTGNALLLASPLVNVQWSAPNAITWTSLSSSAWWTLSPDGSSYMGLPLLWRRPVPQTVNYARCRLFLEAADATAGAGSWPVTVTVWSFNRNPGSDSSIPLVGYSSSETLTSTTAADPGVWIDFDNLRISRTADGEKTWLCVSVEASGASVANLRMYAHAVTIDPMSVIETDAIGGIGNG